MPLPLFPFLFQLAPVLDRYRDFLADLRVSQLCLKGFLLCLKPLDVSFKIRDSRFGFKNCQSRSDSLLVCLYDGKLVFRLLNLLKECCYGLSCRILCWILQGVVDGLLPCMQ